MSRCVKAKRRPEQEDLLSERTGAPPSCRSQANAENGSLASVRSTGRMLGAVDGQSAVYLLVVLLPLTVFIPVGPPLAAGVYPAFVSIGIELSELAALVVVLTAWLRNGEDPKAPGLDPFDRQVRSSIFSPLLLLAALTLVSVPGALQPHLAASSAVRWVVAVGAGWSMARMRFSHGRVAGLLVATLAIHVLIGVGQIYRQAPLGVPGELALERLRLGAAVLPSGDGPWLRPYGLTFHPNVLGGFLAVGLVLGLPLVSRLSLRLLWWVLWLGLFLTFSRSAWVAICASLPIAAFWLYRYAAELRRALRRTLLGAAAITIAAGWATSTQLQSRFPISVPSAERGPNPVEVSDRSPLPSEESVSQRLEMARLSLRVIGSRPLSGVGAGNFPLAMLTERSMVPAQYVHNVPLLVAAEVGCLGGAVWLWLWVATAFLLFCNWERLSAWRVVSCSAWLAFCVVGLFDSYPWALGSGRLLAMALLGLIASPVRGGPGELDARSPALLASESEPG